MANSTEVVEYNLKQVTPRLTKALGGIMPAERLIQTILVSCERTPKLLSCTPQSILNGAMTFAILGLPVDGVTGQGFLLPFGTVAQPLVGYKGYNTLAARSGITITAGTVREGDEFDYEKGSSPFVRHKPTLDNSGRIIAFWACATANDRPPVVEILSLGDVEAIMAKSAAVKNNKTDSPWFDPLVGFPAMGEKSARRRLCRSTPLNINAPQLHLAARLEEAFDEQGKLSWIEPERGVVLEGETRSPLPRRNNDTPTTQQLTGPRVTDDELLEQVKDKLIEAAGEGMVSLSQMWSSISPRYQNKFRTLKDTQLKPQAERVDAERNAPEEANANV